MSDSYSRSHAAKSASSQEPRDGSVPKSVARRLWKALIMNTHNEWGIIALLLLTAVRMLMIALTLLERKDRVRMRGGRSA